METDDALGNLFGERQGKENLLLNARMHQLRIIPEAAAHVVLGIAHQGAAPAALRPHSRCPGAW